MQLLLVMIKSIVQELEEAREKFVNVAEILVIFIYLIVSEMVLPSSVPEICPRKGSVSNWRSHPQTKQNVLSINQTD